MRILLVGYFASNSNDFGGQGVKTQEFFRVLKANALNDSSINSIDTRNWKYRFILICLQYFFYIFHSDVIIMLPSKNGLLVFSWLLVITKKIFKRRIYYSVIGGWLSNFLHSRKFLLKRLRFFNGIFLESKQDIKYLNEKGLNNCYFIPNFKNLFPLKSSEIRTNFSEPLNLVFFARVTKLKGVFDAINSINFINNLHKNSYSLDVYGQIDPSIKEEFFELINKSPLINYKGQVTPNTSTSIIRNYFGLIFPTQHYTEGIPGTLLDALASGVPVITPLWKNHEDVFKENITGLSYTFNDIEGLKKLLLSIKSNPSHFISMRFSSLNFYNNFEPNLVSKQILEIIEGG
jgi:glycosyltransferase involved in cell wall biosynthesis